MASVEELEELVLELRRDLDEAERAIAALTHEAQRPFALRFPTRIQGPEGAAYIVVRASGGNLTTVAASGAGSSDWSDP